METKLTSQNETQAVFTVTLNEGELKKGKAHVFDVHLRPRVKAAGFRPGKAPDHIVERELGSNVVQGEVIDELIQNSYSDAIQELKLPVVASPKITVEKFVPYTELEYQATVELMPPVKLGDYKKLRLKRPAVKVDADEVERTLNDLRRRESSRINSDKPAKLGDEMNFDFNGTKDGKPVQGASATNQTLQLGSGSFIPGFEDELVGLKKDTQKTFTITFPKDYQEKTLAGEDVQFEIKVNTVTELAMPDVDAAFIAKVSPFKTEAELREDIAQKVAGQKTEAAAREYEQQVIDAVVKGSTYTTPEALVRQQLVRNREELEQNLAYSGLDLAKYLELSGKTESDIDKELRPEAERRVGLAMVLTEVAKAEKIEVSEDELDAEIKRMKQDYPDEKAQAELNNPNTREEVYNHMMASRVVTKLLSYTEADIK
jgi:trigger factor